MPLNSSVAMCLEASGHSVDVFFSCARNGIIPSDAVWASVSFAVEGVVPVPAKYVPLEARTVPPNAYRPA